MELDGFIFSYWRYFSRSLSFFLLRWGRSARAAIGKGEPFGHSPRFCLLFFSCGTGELCDRTPQRAALTARTILLGVYVTVHAGGANSYSGFPPTKTERMERGPARSVLLVLIPLPRGYPRFGYFALRAGTGSICAECRELSRASPAIRFPHADARCARGTKCAQQHLLVGRIKVAPP